MRHDPSTHRGFTSEPRGWAVGFTTVTDRGSGLVSVRTAHTGGDVGAVMPGLDIGGSGRCPDALHPAPVSGVGIGVCCRA